jgi:hypothetical protein
LCSASSAVSALNVVLCGGVSSSDQTAGCEHRVEIRRFDRFTQVIVHARLEALLTIARERVGGHRDDGDVAHGPVQSSDDPRGFITVDFGI